MVSTSPLGGDEDAIGRWVLDLREELAVYDRSEAAEAPSESVRRRRARSPPSSAVPQTSRARCEGSFIRWNCRAAACS